MRKTLFSILSAGMVALTAMPAQAFSLSNIRVNVTLPRLVVAPAPAVRVAPLAPVQITEQRHERDWADPHRPWMAPETQVAYVDRRPVEHVVIERRDDHHGFRHHPAGEFNRLGR